ncbi:MAG: acyl carrier protein [Rhodocyclaceae bacterium]|nr:acyl carrier protein [Rhodocyclaceae bacterium]
MDPQQLKQQIVDVIRRIAPELDPQRLDPGLPLRGQIELDSMDMLNLYVRIKEVLGVEICEADYGALGTLDALAAYVGARLGAPAER